MTDNVSTAAGGTAADEFVLEGEGAPAEPQVSANEQPGEGQAGQTDPQGQQAGTGAAKVAVTPDPAKQSKRDRIQQTIRERDAANAAAAASIRKVQQLQQRVAELERGVANEAPEQATARHISRAVASERAEAIADEAQRQQEHATRLSQQAWDEHIAPTRGKYADFDAVVHRPELDITPVMAETLRDDEQGGEIAYHLGRNPAEASRIARLSPAQQVREIVALSAKFAQVATPPAQQPTKAPAPPKTVKGGTAGGAKDLDAMDFEEYRAARLAQMKAARG